MVRSAVRDVLAPIVSFQLLLCPVQRLPEAAAENTQRCGMLHTLTHTHTQRSLPGPRGRVPAPASGASQRPWLARTLVVHAYTRTGENSEMEARSATCGGHLHSDQRRGVPSSNRKQSGVREKRKKRKKKRRATLYIKRGTYGPCVLVRSKATWGQEPSEE